MTLEKKIFGGFGLALAVLLGIVVMAYHNTLQFQESSRLVTQTREVLVELATTLSLMKDAGFGHRGYVITGEERYLEPYDATVRLMPDQIKQVRSLTADNPAQQRRLDALEPLIMGDLQFRAETIRLQRTKGLEAARRNVATGVGKKTMDAIRQLMGEMEKEEHELLSRRSAEAEQRARITIAVIAVGSMLVLVLVASASVIVKRAINERSRAEEELDRFFTLSLDMLCIAKSDGYFKRVSPAFTQTLGWSTEEMLARPFLDFVHPDDRPATLREVEKQVVTGEKVLQFENRYRHKDGSWRTLSWKSVPQPGGFMFATGRDITEGKQIEEQIAENLKALADFKAALDEHAIVAVTDPRGKIIYANDKFCTISKYSREELIGQDHRIINSGHHPKAFIRELWQTIADGRVWKGEIKNRAKDGSFYWVSTTIVPFLGADGKPTQYIAIRADITDRKRAEEQIKKSNEQLEAANKELEAFSYSVSHDLRAPLRHIDGFASLLQKHAAALDEKGRRHLATISDSAKQMGRLIDDLLLFSRTGRAELHMTPVNLANLVKEVQQALKPDMPGREVAWTIGTLPEVHGDPSMLRQVLANLIRNAVKYTSKRENARIEVGCMPGERERAKGDEVVVFVRDNGAGFDQQYAHKLFGVFQRLHSASEFEGTGIGLANVRRIIARHGGRTWADGKVNEGATFYFSLPASNGGNDARLQAYPAG